MVRPPPMALSLGRDLPIVTVGRGWGGREMAWVYVLDLLGDVFRDGLWTGCGVGWLSPLARDVQDNGLCVIFY